MIRRTYLDARGEDLRVEELHDHEVTEHPAIIDLIHAVSIKSVTLEYNDTMSRNGVDGILYMEYEGFYPEHVPDETGIVTEPEEVESRLANAQIDEPVLIAPSAGVTLLEDLGYGGEPCGDEDEHAPRSPDVLLYGEEGFNQGIPILGDKE